MKISVTISAIMALGACAINPSFERTALHYNRVVADTNNEQLFLNIIRASEREPMYFTGFSQLSGDLTYGVTTALSGDLPDDGLTTQTAASAVTTTLVDAVDTLKPSVSASVVNNPSFDFQVLDTQEFFQGITEPVNEETVAHYLQQGWPPEMLAALLIERADFSVTMNGRTTRIGDIDNEPIAYEPDHSGTPAGISLDFGKVLHCIELRPRDGESIKVTNVSVPAVLTGAAKGAFGQMALPENTTFGFDPVSGNLDLKYRTNDEVDLFASQPPRGVSETAFEQGCVREISLMMSALRASGGPAAPVIHFESGDEIKIALAVSPQDASEGDCLEGRAGCAELSVNLVFRSVQGAMYFLGEYVRADLLDKSTTDACGIPDRSVYRLRDCKRLISVSTAESDTAFVATELNGQYYQVNRHNKNQAAEEGFSPTRDDDYSLSVFAFINQLLNLQKSASERPTTSSVRVR